MCCGFLRGAAARRIGARHAGRGGTGRGNTRGASRRRAAAGKRRASFHHGSPFAGIWAGGARGRPRGRTACCARHGAMSQTTQQVAHLRSSVDRLQVGAPRLHRHPRPPVLQRCAAARSMASGGGGSPAAAEAASPLAAEAAEAAAPASTPARRGSGGLAALDAAAAGSNAAAASTPLPHPAVTRSDSLVGRPEWLPSPEVVEQRTKPLKTFFVRPGSPCFAPHRARQAAICARRVC